MIGDQPNALAGERVESIALEYVDAREDVGGGTERCTEQGGENGQTIRHGKDTVVQCMKN